VVENDIKSGPQLMSLMTTFRERMGRDGPKRSFSAWGVTSKTIVQPKEGEMAEGDWWFDLKTHTVVPDNNDTKITDRLGPYKTREEAERALELVEERNEAYDNDPRWNDDL
jgi:hypothetical protein